jgi:hypothetical protein
LGDGAQFGCTLIPTHPLSEEFLGHLDLTCADFDTALTLGEARRRWAAFQRPGDVVTVIQPGTARLFSTIANAKARCLVLKSVDLKSLAVLAVENPNAPEREIASCQSLGRATRRLTSAIILVRQLNAIVNGRQGASTAS